MSEAEADDNDSAIGAGSRCSGSRSCGWRHALTPRRSTWRPPQAAPTLFGQQLLAQVPRPRTSGTDWRQRELPQEPFLQLLSESLDAAEAERVLRTAIEWGRYGEVFEYDFHTGLIHLPSDADAAPS